MAERAAVIFYGGLLVISCLFTAPLGAIARDLQLLRQGVSVGARSSTWSGLDLDSTDARRFEAMRDCSGFEPVGCVELAEDV